MTWYPISIPVCAGGDIGYLLLLKSKKSKTRFLSFAINWYGLTDGTTNKRLDKSTDGQTQPLIEMRSRIWKFKWEEKLNLICILQFRENHFYDCIEFSNSFKIDYFFVLKDADADADSIISILISQSMLLQNLA